jgi:chromosome segregation ATPase
VRERILLSIQVLQGIESAPVMMKSEIRDAELQYERLLSDLEKVTEEIRIIENRLASCQNNTAKADALIKGPLLYEVSAIVSYTAVICAVSERDAMEEVETWEQAWHDTADLIEVHDVEITHTRPVLDAKSESHDITQAAGRMLSTRAVPVP